MHEVLVERRHLFKEDDEIVTGTKENRRLIYSRQGLYETSKGVLERRNRRLGGNHTTTSRAMGNLASKPLFSRSLRGSGE